MSQYPPLKLTDPMPFGKHIGILVGSIMDKKDGPGYIRWAINNTDARFAQAVHDYLKEFKL